MDLLLFLVKIWLPGQGYEFGGLKRTGKPSLIFRYVKNYMKGKKIKLTSPFKDEKYNLFIMERNEYIGSKTWPPKETVTIPYMSVTQPERNEISVWATGYQINTGHKLRVVISSSWFPRYNRSLNSCEPIYSAIVMTTAHQKIWFGGDNPSSVNLPVYVTSNKN